MVDSTNFTGLSGAACLRVPPGTRSAPSGHGPVGGGLAAEADDAANVAAGADEFVEMLVGEALDGPCDGAPEPVAVASVGFSQPANPRTPPRKNSRRRVCERLKRSNGGRVIEPTVLTGEKQCNESLKRREVPTGRKVLAVRISAAMGSS
jgi:hypothetical protein